MAPAVNRAFQILELVAASPHPLKVSEIVAQLALPRSAVYGLVNTLRQREVLSQLPDGRVVIGRKMFILGSAYAHSLDIVREATEVAEALSAECDETVQVAVLDGRYVIYVAKADSIHPLRLVSSLGKRLPAHCTSLGKAQLAYLPDRERDALLKGATLEKLTPNSIVDLAALEVELERIRARGYAFDECESNPGVACVGAPVWDGSGAVVAGMSVSVPEVRFDRERRDALRDLVVRGAMELSRRLGFDESKLLREPQVS